MDDGVDVYDNITSRIKATRFPANLPNVITSEIFNCSQRGRQSQQARVFSKAVNGQAKRFEQHGAASARGFLYGLVSWGKVSPN
ncbi:MAG: hypothetical protein AAB401_19100 [Acidobacteriota bacterium]